MDKPTFVAAWFGAAFTTLIFSILFSIYLSQPKEIKQVNQSFKLYAALPENSIKFEQEIEPVDARSRLIEDFFNKYKSPLGVFAQVFVKVADGYKLDYRLLPSIAMQESNGGKKVIADSFNPFGYGIYGDKVKKFNSYEEAIERVGQGLREDYLNIGLNTPEEIMPKYTPPSVAKGGPWARGVFTFMEELR